MNLPPLPSSIDYVPPKRAPFKEYIATAGLFLTCWLTLMGLILAVCIK